MSSITLHRVQRKLGKRVLASLIGAICAAGLSCTVAHSDPVEDFYRGKTVTVYVASDAGGGYAPYGQLAARFLGRYLPGHPDVVVSYMPGGGGITAANYLYNVAHKDGTAIGVLFAQLQLAQFLQPGLTKYDATKFQWLGIFADITQAFSVAKRTGVKTAADLKTTQIVAGSTGSGSDTFLVPTLANETLGTKMKIVSGYNGTSALNLAMERGEIDAFVAPWGSIKSSFPQVLQTAVQVFQYGLKRQPDYPDIPLLSELVTDPKQRAMVRFLAGPSAIGRSLTAPPGVPADRIAALRKAFDEIVADTEFKAETAKNGIEISSEPGTEAESTINDLSHVDANVLSMAKAIIPSTN